MWAAFRLGREAEVESGEKEREVEGEAEEVQQQRVGRERERDAIAEVAMAMAEGAREEREGERGGWWDGDWLSCHKRLLWLLLLLLLLLLVLVLMNRWSSRVLAWWMRWLHFEEGGARMGQPKFPTSFIHLHRFSSLFFLPLSLFKFLFQLQVVTFLRRAFTNLFPSKTNIFKVFGPLSRCEPNLDQEKWPCTKKWMSWFS
jgi:hypothetical protein